MTRVSTLAGHELLRANIAARGEAMVRAQAQVASGKRAGDLAGYGLDAKRLLDARSIGAKESAYAAAAQRVGDRLTVQDGVLTQLRQTTLDFRSQIASALAAGEGRGLTASAAATFAAARAAFDLRHEGGQLFATASGEAPLLVSTIDELAALPGADAAFADAGAPASARIGDAVDLSFGLAASEVGEPLLAALRTFRLADPAGFEGILSDADVATLTSLLGDLDAAVATIDDAQAANGQKQAFAEERRLAATGRADLFETIAGGVEDVDIAEAITRLQQEQTALQASYQAFARVAGLSLADYL